MKFILIIILILNLGCTPKPIKGFYRLRNGYNPELWGFVSHYYSFNSLNNTYYFYSGNHSFQVSSEGVFKQENEHLILNSNIDNSCLPFQAVELKESDCENDSINLKLKTNLNTYQIYNFTKKQYENIKSVRIIEIDSILVDTLPDGIDIKYKLKKGVRKIRLKFLNTKFPYEYSNKVFTSDYLIIENNKICEVNLVFNVLPQYYNNVSHLNDTLLIINNQKLYSKKDSIYYYKDNKRNRKKLRNEISYKE